MARMRRGTRPTKAQFEKSKEEDRKNCMKGSHGIFYQPVYTNRLWNGKDVYCKLCGFETTISKIKDKFWRKWVRDCDKLYKELHEKVKALHPRQEFNKDGY